MSGIAHDQPQSVYTCFLGLLDYSIFKLQKSSYHFFFTINSLLNDLMVFQPFVGHMGFR